MAIIKTVFIPPVLSRYRPILTTTSAITGHMPLCIADQQQEGGIGA
jgi:hypothetical protein